MARPNKGGWDFVKTGGVYQYKESSDVCVVEILANHSTPESYDFQVKVLASSRGFTPGDIFTVGHYKELPGIYPEMPQFYETFEYLPLPFGNPWPKALPGYEYYGIEDDNVSLNN